MAVAPFGDAGSELAVVGIGAFDGLGEYGRVGGHPSDTVGHVLTRGGRSVVLAGEPVLFGGVPDRGIASCLDVESVVEDEGPAERGADRHQHRDDS